MSRGHRLTRSTLDHFCFHSFVLSPIERPELPNGSWYSLDDRGGSLGLETDGLGHADTCSYPASRPGMHQWQHILSCTLCLRGSMQSILTFTMGRKHRLSLEQDRKVSARGRQLRASRGPTICSSHNPSANFTLPRAFLGTSKRYTHQIFQPPSTTTSKDSGIFRPLLTSNPCHIVRPMLTTRHSGRNMLCNTCHPLPP